MGNRCPDPPRPAPLSRVSARPTHRQIAELRPARCVVKITDITFSQAIRFLSVSGQGGGTLYGVNLIRALEMRYGFWESPKTVADYDLNKGVTFLHGLFDREFVIDKFQVYTNGILAEAKVPTDKIDEFLDDVTEWAQTDVGLRISEGESKKLYNSHLEVFAEFPLTRALRQFSKLGDHITNLTRAYGVNTSRFHVSSISLNADNEGLPTPKPAAFVFDRRAGKPYESGLFFSSAPLRTSEHQIILDELESIFTDMASR
jgi:hypothetical protein